MTSYLYILGRTPDLAFLELKTFLPDVSRVTDDVAQGSSTVPIDRLGGTVKIAENVGHIATITPEILAPYIDRATFGLSFYGMHQKPTRILLEGIKTLVSGSGRHVRFVEARDGSELSSVVISKQHVQEYVVVKKDDGYVLGKTIAVQPFDDWGVRDFGRPNADPHAGMLPPKVSRMIVNIADRKRDNTQLLTQKTLLDPFCGMGTILGEALVMGWNVVGSDVDDDVVTRARENIRWLTEHKIAAEGVTCRLNVVDATHVSEMVDHGTIDAIVTEPFMGPTKVKDVKNTIKGLEKLYIGCLREWLKVLKPNGVILMAMPLYTVAGKTYSVKKVIDKCEMLGYTIQEEPIEYGRPGAIVKRVFYLFQKK